MKNACIFCVLLISFEPFSSVAQGNNAFPVQVRIEHGTIEGNYDIKTGIQTYFGIPFAKPPVGDLRWKAPQPPEKWAGVKETKKFGPRPMQTDVFGDMESRSDGVSEDCLYLNVWTPAKRNTTNLPVLVYFFGGGFVAGDASEYRYDGESMAGKGIVVVTVNYRLNIFGFLAHPELSEEAPYHASGNYGLLDQQAALQWVQNNITAFGGNPDKVTIAGESAGSISVSLQMASPLSRDLIDGAIGESGAAIHPTLPPVPLEEAEKIGLEFARKAGYPRISQLRALSARDIYEIYNESNRFGFPIVIDGYFLPESLPEIFNAGKQAQVPLLLGWNSAEVSGKDFMQGQPYSRTNYLNQVKQVYPETYEEVLKFYPAGTEKEIEKSATALASDRFISYSTWKWFDLHRKYSDQPVYRYLYSKIPPPGKNDEEVMYGNENLENPAPVGAPHAVEIPYCMGNLPLIDEFEWTAEDYTVMKVMQNYFANFIKYGNPNGDNLPEWTPAKPEDNTPPVMIIDTKSGIQPAEEDARFEFLDKHYAND
jgi:para-nitrobenzyl esterase